MMKHKLFILAAASGLSLTFATTGSAQVMLEKVVIAAGGNTASNSTNRVWVTAGQPVIGTTSSSNAKAQLGFWTSEKPASGVTGSITTANDLTIKAWPNPASGLTKIDVNMPASNELDLRLFDLAGHEVKTIFTGGSQSGSHSFTMNVSDLPSGTYILAARVPGELVEKSISVIR